MLVNRLAHIILLISMLGSTALISAQSTDEDAALFASPVFVEAVTLADITETTFTLAISGQHPDGCDYPVQIVQDMNDDGLFIDIFREADRDAMCPMVMRPYEAELSISEGFDATAYIDDPLYIEINGEAYWLQTAADGSLEPGQRSPVVLDQVTLDVRDEALILSVQGALGTGCNVPPIVRRQQALEYGDVRLSIAQALPEEIACTKMIRPYETEIELEGVSADQMQTIIINDISILYSPQVSAQSAEGDSMRVNSVIASATITRDETNPGRITLQVSGHHSNGCKMPVQIEHQVLGSTVQVEIYRMLPPDVMCPQVLQPFEETIVLDDIYLTGRVTFNINGKIIQQDL